MNRRALVVGLGTYALGLLEAVQTAFEDEQQASALRTLWLRSPLDEEAPARISRATRAYSLSLDDKRLSHLYYEDSTRLWSSANWRNWGAYLAENRLLGKLAAHHHLGEIKRQIESLMAELAQDSYQPLNFYLIAPLADPFASGALLDVAYLLHDVALDSGARAYGLLLLPGTADEPLTGHNDEQTRLLQAIAYAALRELHFLSGPSSFYNNWHPQPHVRLNGLKNTSPFQTGDAYLLGGRLDEKQQTLAYHAVCWQAARFVLYQTTTALGRRLPSSRPNQSLFSSFGLAQTSEQEALLNDQAIQAELAFILRQLIGDRDDAPASFDAQRWLRPDHRGLRYDEVNSQIAELSAVAREAARHSLKEIRQRNDQRYQRTVDKLEAFFEEIERYNQRALDEALPALEWQTPGAQTAFSDMIQQGETTLYGLNAAYQALLRGFRERRKTMMEELSQLHQQVETATSSLRHKRSRYAFVAQNFGAEELLVQAMLWGWLAIGLVLAISGGLLLTSSAVLLAAVLLSILLSVWYRQQRLEAFANEWSEAQMSSLRDQLSLFEKLYELAYLSALERGFRAAWRTQTNQTPLETMIADLQTIQASYAAEPRSVSGVDWPNLRATLMMALVEAKQAGQMVDNVWLVDQVSKLGLLRDAVQQTSNARRCANQLQAELGSLLCFKEALVKQNIEAYQETTFTLYHCWGVLDNLQPDEIELDDQRMRRVTVIRLTCSLPLRALCNLDDWRRSYHASCLTQDQPPLERRALLHPTRLGLVASDIVVEGWPATLRNWPHMAMILTLFLRLFAPGYAARQAVAWAILSQGSDEKLFYDELCGQFQQEPAVLVDWLERARRKPYREDVLAHVVSALGDYSRRSVSETWSEWESWTCEWIIQNIKNEDARAVICGLHQVCATLEEMSLQEKQG